MFRILAFSLLLISPVFAQKDFPDGPAREYVNKICLQCHGEPSQLLNQKKIQNPDWRATTVARMALKGVPAPAEQYDAIAAYMAKNFPKGRHHKNQHE